MSQVRLRYTVSYRYTRYRYHLCATFCFSLRTLVSLLYTWMVHDVDHAMVAFVLHVEYIYMYMLLDPLQVNTEFIMARPTKF